ncbi:MAG: AtpZ/AtpI family protein [Planctomycetota bacterium]|nr:AtpZ/AtpI family protein [Planctomycetota bacterium]
MKDSDNHRATSNAMRWVSQVTSIGMELAIPAGVGVWLDSKYGTLPGWTLVGVCFGSYLAFRGLQQLLRDLEK